MQNQTPTQAKRRPEAPGRPGSATESTSGTGSSWIGPPNRAADRAAPGAALGWGPDWVGARRAAAPGKARMEPCAPPPPLGVARGSAPESPAAFSSHPWSSIPARFRLRWDRSPSAHARSRYFMLRSDGVDLIQPNASAFLFSDRIEPNLQTGRLASAGGGG